MNEKIYLFGKLVYAEGFEGDASPRTAAYSNSVTDSSIASLSKSPAEVEFRKRSIITNKKIALDILPLLDSLWLFLVEFLLIGLFLRK
ncbi:MAG: palindromic element RPE1 domain-containing protein [Candidatus Tisiphia sp.]